MCKKLKKIDKKNTNKLYYKLIHNKQQITNKQTIKMAATINNENLKKILKLAVETNDTQLLNFITEWISSKQCSGLSIDKNSKDVVENKMICNINRPIVVEGVFLNMSKKTLHVGGNSWFMVMLVTDPKQALIELEAGKIPLEVLNHKNDRKWSPLTYVCRNANLIPDSEKIIRKLLDNCVDLNLNTKEVSSCLHLSCENVYGDSNEQTVEILWNDSKMDVNVEDEDGDTPLICFLKNYDEKKSQKLLKMMIESKKLSEFKGKDIIKILLNNNFKKMMPVVEELLTKVSGTINIMDEFDDFAKLNTCQRKELFNFLSKLEKK